MEKVMVADLTNPLHAQAVVELLNEYAKDAMGGGTALADAVKDNLVSELRKRPHIFAVLAFSDDKPAGLAICMEGFSTFACMPLINIHDLVVAPAFRGRGLSHKILQTIEVLAKSRHCCKLTLEVLEGNKIAQNAYRAFGFEGYQLNPETGRALFWQKNLL